MDQRDATPWPGDDDTRPQRNVPLGGTALDAPLELKDHRYDTTKVLGEGGMGQVREVLDSALGRRVAMKVMHPQIAETLDGQRRFLREARVQGQLEHPAVVPVYDLGVDAHGASWFTMKQVRGVTLETVLTALAEGDPEVRARYPRRRLLTAFVQVCLAIDFAHSRAVLHRDLKPGNIMLGDFGDVHVLDWGLAQVGQDSGPARDLEQAIAQATRGGSVFGTPGFMAPEQIHGDRLDARADVYSLGAILFELLALSPLHLGPPMERIAATLRGEQRSACLTAPAADVPPELDAAVLAATQHSPSDRTPTARALAEAVERYLDGDRDLEVRRALAARHLAAAAPLMENLDEASTAQREAAMGQLSAALALDPGNAAALELMTRLITHVPTTLPPEVESTRQHAEAQARAGVARAVALRLGIVFVFGSFMVVPVIASTCLLMFTGHLKPGARVAAILIAMVIVLLPFLLEELALISPAYEFTMDQVRLVPRMVHFPPGLTKLVLVLATLSS